MNRKLCTWVVVAIAGGAFGAGCGSSSSSTSSSQISSTPAASTPAAPATTTTQATSPAATGTASRPTSTTAGGGASALAAQQIVAECQAVIHRASTLSASVKAKVEGICNKAAGGDLAGARAAAKEVCVEVINSSPVPAAAKQQALAACNKQ
jgi:hypothetical protein